MEPKLTAGGIRRELGASGPTGPRGTGCYSPPVWVSNAGSAVLITCFQGNEFKAVPHERYVVNVVLISHGHATLLPWLNTTAEGVTAFP